jgi:hypothetical protein
MKIYKILIKGTSRIIGRVQAESPKEAIKKYKENNPSFELDVIARKDRNLQNIIDYCK